MMKRLEISGVHLELGDDLKKYVTRKIGRLDRFVPRAAHDSLHGQVKLLSSKAKDKNDRTCEVILYLPHDTLVVKETTINIYAAIDIAEHKLHHQLKKYKELHAPSGLRQRLLGQS